MKPKKIKGVYTQTALAKCLGTDQSNINHKIGKTIRAAISEDGKTIGVFMPDHMTCEDCENDCEYRNFK